VNASRFILPAVAALAIACGGADSTPPSPQSPTPSAIVAGQSTTIAAVAGAAVQPAPTFIVNDAAGNALAGVPVSVAVASGGGTLAGSPVVSASGPTPVGTWTLGATSGENTLAVTSSRLPGATLTITAWAVPGPATQMVATAGAGQTADVNDPVPTPPSVTVKDANNNGVSGVVVTFVVGSGGGRVSDAEKGTDAKGVAALDTWVLGSQPGSNTLVASAPGLAPVTFTATALADTGVLLPRPVAKTSTQKLYMSYMPWFETPKTSSNGRWGSHWTMNTANPDVILANGRRQIAAFYYPMIGPYASSDRDVIDYHLLLMKYAGVDGVLVDWYGTHPVFDYPPVKRNTDSLFARVGSSGVEFGIIYEDATLQNVKTIAGIDPVPAAQQDFLYLQSRYFASAGYTKINGQPLVLDFGPQVLKTVAEWQAVFAVLGTQPAFLALNYAPEVGRGEFAWPGQGHLTAMQSFYQNRAPRFPIVFGAAYPGFDDYYAPGGWVDCCNWVIPHNGTATLQATLDLAKTFNMQYVQLVTWNDYGEGTMIEPTLDFGFSFLETIQQRAGVPYTVAELQLIYKWYTLRKKYAGNLAIQQQLTQAYYLLASLRVAKAKALLGGIE